MNKTCPKGGNKLSKKAKKSKMDLYYMKNGQAKIKQLLRKKKESKKEKRKRKKDKRKKTRNFKR